MSMLEKASPPLRPELPPLPARMRRLPVDGRGYPVPWFVAWLDGAPEFRVADSAKWLRAVRDGRCWVCGERLGAFKAFLIGPMCAVNRTSAEPPCHRECAIYSATACPFLSRPHMRRREGGLPADVGDVGGMPIRRNPGVALVWITRSYRVVADGMGGRLIKIGESTEVAWYAEGRAATRGEILASIESGLLALRTIAEEEGPPAVAALERATTAAMAFVPR